MEMSGREVEPALHLGLAFQQIPETSTVPVTSGETSRKRTADEEPAADVPSASRRRRNTNTDPSSYIRPTFPSCCVNGVEPTCLIPSPPGFDPTAAANVASPLAPIYGTQVFPQIHAQLAVPSTSIVHNVTPIALHVHGPPSIASNYAYFVPHPQNLQTHRIVQPLMGLRLPTTPVHYVAQDIAFAEQGFLPSLLPEIPEDYHGIQRPPEFYPPPPPPPPPPGAAAAINNSNNWDPGAAQYRLYPGFSYVPRAANNRMDAVVSRVQVAQAAAQVGVDPAAAAQMLVNPAQVPPAQVDYYSDGWGEVNQNPVPLIDGPVAVPTMAAEWAPPQGANENVPAPNYPQQFEIARMANGEIPFRAWEAAVLHIFDRMAPQMNPTRLPPKGMTKNEIDQLKSFRITDPALLMEKVCVICQCDFEKRDLVRVLPCTHHYHLKCVDKWLKGNRTCPICRQLAAPEAPENGQGAAAAVTPPAGTVAATAGVAGVGAVADNGVVDEIGGNGNQHEVQVITQVGTAVAPPAEDTTFSDPQI